MRIGHLVVGMMAGCLVAASLWPVAHTGLVRREAAGTALSVVQARLAAARTPAAPLMRADRTLRADSSAAALREVARRVRREAARQGVLVEAVRPARAAPGLTRMDLRISGAEKSVLSLADALENGAPVARFERWKIAAIADGQVRLEAVMVSPWHA